MIVPENVITHTVLVDYDLTPEELLAAVVSAGRVPCVDSAVLAAMPRPMGMSGKREVQSKVFKPRPTSYQRGDFISGAALQAEYLYHGVIADPWLSFARNAADPSFADTYPNDVSWQDADDGRWHFASFIRRDGERRVVVSLGVDVWFDDWFFIGRVK